MILHPTQQNVNLQPAKFQIKALLAPSFLLYCQEVFAYQIATNFNGQICVEKRRRIPEGTYLCKVNVWKTMFMFDGHKLIIDCYFSEYEINISFICNIQISPDGTVKIPVEEVDYSSC